MDPAGVRDLAHARQGTLLRREGRDNSLSITDWHRQPHLGAAAGLAQRPGRRRIGPSGPSRPAGWLPTMEHAHRPCRGPFSGQRAEHGYCCGAPSRRWPQSGLPERLTLIPHRPLPPCAPIGVRGRRPTPQGHRSALRPVASGDRRHGVATLRAGRRPELPVCPPPEPEAHRPAFAGRQPLLSSAPLPASPQRKALANQ